MLSYPRSNRSGCPPSMRSQLTDIYNPRCRYQRGAVLSAASVGQSYWYEDGQIKMDSPFPASTPPLHHAAMAAFNSPVTLYSQCIVFMLAVSVCCYPLSKLPTSGRRSLSIPFAVHMVELEQIPTTTRQDEGPFQSISTFPQPHLHSHTSHAPAQLAKHPSPT
jgi:hypothetical protein